MYPDVHVHIPLVTEYITHLLSVCPGFSTYACWILVRTLVAQNLDDDRVAHENWILLLYKHLCV